MKRFACVVLAAAVMAAGCGKSEEEKRAEEAAKAAETAAKSAEQTAATAAKGLESLAKGLTAAAGGSSDAKPVDPVKFQDLIALLPEIDGWQKEKPEGERMTAPFPYSSAHASYTKGDARLEVKITDSGFNQMLLLPYAMFLQAGYSKESSSGYEKSTTVGGQPGWETWNSDAKNGTINAVVGKRFLVNVEGSGLENAKVLQDTAQRMDFAKLAELK